MLRCRGRSILIRADVNEFANDLGTFTLMRSAHIALAGAIAFLSACSKATVEHGANGGGANETIPVHALSRSDPAELAVARWHDSLVSGDFTEYNSMAVRGADDDDSLRVLAFDRLRQGLPRVIFAADATQEVQRLSSADGSGDPGSWRTFSLVGCIRAPADKRQIRVMASVSTHKIDGTWKVYGGSFGPPSTPFVGACPIED